MEHFPKNGNGGAVILPPTPKVIRGRSLAHKQLDKRQRACIAADAIEGLTTVDPTKAQVAAMLGVSLAYVAVARKLPPGKRAAILRGWDPTPFAGLMKGETGKAVTRVKVITDSDLANLARAVGPERMLEAAATVEAAE